MNVGGFNILQPDNAIHSMGAIGYNCGPARKGYRAWVTPKGMPLAATRCGREFQTSGWLWQLFDLPCQIAIEDWVSEFGFWYVKKFKIYEFEEYNNDGIYLPIAEGALLDRWFDVEEDIGGFHPTAHLNPVSLEPYASDNWYQKNECVRFKIKFRPYCERMGIIQNVWFDSDMVPHKTPETDFVWFAPQKDENRENVEFLEDNQNRRPFNSPPYGLGNLPSKAYADFTWTPKRNWKGSNAGYHAENDSNHIWGDPNIEKIPWLYEKPDIYWGMVQDGEPEHWDFNRWAASLCLNSYEGGGRGYWSELWEGGDFKPIWANADDFKLDIPVNTVVDVRVEVLTYKWSFWQESHYKHYPDPESQPNYFVWQTMPWTCISARNYMNARLWTTLRQVAPCKSTASLGL